MRLSFSCATNRQYLAHDGAKISGEGVRGCAERRCGRCWLQRPSRRVSRTGRSRRMGAPYPVIVGKTDFTEAAILALVCPWAAARFDPTEPHTNANLYTNGPGRLARRFGGRASPSIAPSAHRSTGVEQGQAGKLRCDPWKPPPAFRWPGRRQTNLENFRKQTQRE